MAIDGWASLKTSLINIIPSEEIIAGWQPLKTILTTLEPSEVIIGGWKNIGTMTIRLKSPIIVCSTDADCPEGYICINGVCVKKEGLPLAPFAIGAAAVGAIILVSSRKKKKETK